ncbi:rod shape-determining protein MreD [Vallitaleaceae bacterium 9-2]
MIKKISTGLIIIFIIILQTTLFQQLSINNTTPNLFIITIVSISALMGRKDGLLYAILFGVVQDIQFGGVVGFYVLVYAIIAYVSGYLYRNYYAESMMIPLIVIGLSDLFYNLVIFIFTYLLRGRLELGYYFGFIIAPEVTYTVFIGVLFYRLYIIYFNFLRMTHTKKRKGEDAFNEGDF